MIKRYFIVVLLLSLFPAGVSAQRRAAAKKIGKRNTIMWVQCMTDVFSYTGAERVAIPVWAVLYGRLFRLYGHLRYGGLPAHL